MLFTETDENLLVSVYTINGQQLMTKRVRNVNIQETLDVDLGSVNSGAYIVKITGKKISQTFRLLVQ
ncbi:MAG: T9SS type A sorting domain-containing protein [Paludibacteraceae bacterium]|nr:T9SS type A sorting domain-containing protein [Paludibacteraceae bacterium]